MKKSVEAIHELMEEGQPLVYSIVSKVVRSVPVRVDTNDLIAYGEIGLAQAARDFNPNMGTQFTTFAYQRIRGEIYDGLSKMTWMSRSRFRRIRFKQLANEMLTEEARENRSDQKDVSAESDWMGDISEKLAVVFLSTTQEDFSEEAIPDDEDQAPTAVAKREQDEILHEVVRTLPSQQERLITMIYFDGCTIKQAADRMGMSKSWASRLHAKAIEELGLKIKKRI